MGARAPGRGHGIEKPIIHPNGPAAVGRAVQGGAAGLSPSPTFNIFLLKTFRNAAKGCVPPWEGLGAHGLQTSSFHRIIEFLSALKRY